MRSRRAPAALSAVFLDRDGVINRKAAEGDYVRNWAAFTFLPGALEALALLATLDVPLVVVTNQRGIARGLMSEATVRDIHTRMVSAVAAAGGRIDRVEFCPHEPGTCDCRKPGTAMFHRAKAAIPAIDFIRSAMVGDRAADMQAARRIGAYRVLVRPVAGASRSIDADLVVADLRDATRALVGR
ncbi:MAG: D-glycero-alpha-D-manno-heptose-1,7-bisphosphate 7-phosphatase [Solirubrobacteraceae bacterium]